MKESVAPSSLEPTRLAFNDTTTATYPHLLEAARRSLSAPGRTPEQTQRQAKAQGTQEPRRPQDRVRQNQKKHCQPE